MQFFPMLAGELHKVNVQLPIPKSQKHPVMPGQAVTTDRLSDEIGLLAITELVPSMSAIGKLVGVATGEPCCPGAAAAQCLHQRI